MKIIVNTTNLNIGGVIQVALSFLEELKKITQHKYYIFMTSTIASQLDQNKFPENFYFYEFQHSPSSLIYGIQMIFKLKYLENKIKPECVFSMFGPSYWSPKAPHLMGFALPRYVYPEYLKNLKLSFTERCIFIIKKVLHRYFFKINAKYYVTETQDVTKRLPNFIPTNEKNIYTVSNTYSHIYNLPINNLDILPKKKKGEFRLITISAYYKHKNLEIINKIIPILKAFNINVKFILTLPNEIFLEKFEPNGEYIINLGPVPIKSCPNLYSKSDALFMPTLLECFSATYPEAMKMGKPILTSDLSFAHDICGKAAIYFNPLDPEDITNKIIKLSNNIELQKELVMNGKEKLKQFETSQSRALKYLEICRIISEKKTFSLPTN